MPPSPNYSRISARKLMKLRINLQSASQFVETETIYLEFFWKCIAFTLLTFVLTQMCPSPSPMFQEPHVFWTTEITVISKSTLGRGKSPKCFKICDEYRRLKNLNLNLTSTEYKHDLQLKHWAQVLKCITFSPFFQWDGWPG